MNPEKLRVAREKLTRVFRYLEALNQHRNPAKRQIREQLWSLWLHDLPEHASIKRGASKSSTAKTKAADSQNGDASAGGFVLKVQRPELTSPPEPPYGIAAWLEAGWDDPSKEPSISASRNESDQEGETRVANFEDDPARLAALRRWKVVREAERVELVLGDGILSWNRAEGSIYHPILLQRLQLQFSAAVPEFTLSEADHPVELYSALLQSVTDVDGRAIGRCREELEQEGFHPLINGATSGFLKR